MMFKRPALAFSLSTEIGGMFVLLGLLPLFLIGWQYYKGVEREIHEEISRNLTTLADSQVERFEAYARDARKEVQVLANSSVVARAMSRLSLGRDTDLGEVGEELLRYRDDIEADDLFLISATGKILFAAQRQEMININLHGYNADYYQLASAFDRARTLLEPHNSDIAKDSLTQEASGFVAAPIIKNGYVLGVVALRVNKEGLFRIIEDYSGLGRTGETMVAGRVLDSVEIFGPLRFPIDGNRIVHGEFKEPFLSALSGERNVGLTTDYRGKEVIAAWRYVPSFRWGLVVKVDAEERLTAVTLLRNMGILLLLVMAFLVIVVSLFMARAITTPIRQLETAARTLAEKGEAALVPERGAWEINSLAQAFNGMSARIQSYQTGLRRMVDERTFELKHAKDEAEKATRAKTDFLAMMSHEIRTPLNGLLGMAELLKSQKMGPLARDYVQTLHQSGAALSDLLNDLLDISRIEAGKFDLEERKFSPRTLVDSLSALMCRSAEMKGLRYDLQVAGNVPDTVSGDPARLRQILLNLIGNAIKFTAQGHICLKLDIGEVSADNVELRFSVIDSGIGIPEDQADKLFQPFSQLSESRSRLYGGAGLGLAISQRLAQRMGGLISVDSHEGEGSCFEVSLPFKVVNALDEIEEIKLDVPFQRILIVEDEPVNRRVLSGLLRLDGHQVYSAGTAEEAFEILRFEQVDLVLTDLRLPGASGFDVIETVSKEGKTAVIAVTANLMPDDVKRCLDAGAVDVVAKPIMPDALQRAIFRAVSQEKHQEVEMKKEQTLVLFSSAYLDQLSEVLPQEEVRDLINKARYSVNEHLENLKSATDAANISHVAHKLAGVSGTYGMLELRQLAKTIETTGQLTDVKSLDLLVERSLNALSGWTFG